jgi:hypothetical protein
LRVRSRVFAKTFLSEPRLNALLLKYVHLMLVTAGQSAAYNAQRLARWLLMAHDRIGRDELP